MIESVLDTFWKMASPLSPLSPSSQNVRIAKPVETPTPSPLKNQSFELRRESETEVTSTVTTTRMVHQQEHDIFALEHENENDGRDFSSPFIKDAAMIQNQNENERTPSPSKSKKLAGFQIATDDEYAYDGEDHVGAANGDDGFEDSPTRYIVAPVQEGIEQEQSVVEDSVIHHTIDVGDEGMSTIYHETERQVEGDETGVSLNVDVETDAGDLSTFSAVPNTDMTLFANLRRNSPTKSIHNGDRWSPSKQLVMQTPQTANRNRSRSPQKHHIGTDEDEDEYEETPRRPHDDGDMTDLLNFTGQSFAFPPPTPGSATSARLARRSPSGRGAFPVRPMTMYNTSSSPTKSQAALDRERALNGADRTASPFKRPFPSTSTATPSNHRTMHHNLLDLDLDPAPTPRSIPTITPRELESLRSALTSEISSLSATLSGREAEISALKRSVADAEARVGKAMEDARGERMKREELEEGKEDGERRTREMEGLLREVRQEVLVMGREEEKAREWGGRVEREKEGLEGKVKELEAQLEAARSASVRVGSGGEEVPATPRMRDADAAVKEATERVARELHSLYKGKHETKVAALKKSYEARWEKRVRELETQLKGAQEEVLGLRTEKEQGMSGVVPASLAALGNAEEEKQKQKEIEEELRKHVEEAEAKAKVLEAKIEGLEREIKTLKDEGAKVRAELERERVEKGELVGVVDVWLRMQDEANSNADGDSGEDVGNASIISLQLQDGIENLRSSIRCATGAAPGAGTGAGLRYQTHQSHFPGAVGSRGSAIPTPGETRIGRAPVGASGGVGGIRGAARAGRSRSNSRTRIGGPGMVRSGLMEGIARMGGGGAGGGAGRGHS